MRSSRYFFNNGYSEASFDWSQTPVRRSGSCESALHHPAGPARVSYATCWCAVLEPPGRTWSEAAFSFIPGTPSHRAASAKRSRGFMTWASFPKWKPRCRIPAAPRKASTCCSKWTKPRNTPSTSESARKLARIGGGVTTYDDPAGTTGFSPRVTGGISRLNFLGRPQTVSLQSLRLDTRAARACSVICCREFTGNPNLTLTFSGLFDNSTDIRTFAAQRAEGAVQLAQRLTRANSLQYRFAFRHVITSDVKIVPQLIPLLAQPVRVGLLSMSYIHDRRDNQTETHRGIYNTVDVGIALPQFGSQTDYTRLVLRNSTYHPLTRDCGARPDPAVRLHATNRRPPVHSARGTLLWGRRFFATRLPG